MKKNRKGFTLAELLIVVAIIAVLVAIAIPVFSTQLEKSREATDLANIRAAYATIVAEYIDGNEDVGAIEVPVTQKKAGWQSTEDGTAYLQTMVDGTIGKVSIPGEISGKKSYVVAVNPDYTDPENDDFITVTVK